MLSEVATETTSRKVQSYAYRAQLPGSNEQMKRKTLVSIQLQILNQVHSLTKLPIKQIAMSVLRMVNRAFRGLDKDDFLITYKSFISQTSPRILCAELEPTFFQR